MMKNNIVLIFKMLVAIVYLLFVVMGVGEAIIVFIKGDSYYPFGAEATSNTFWYDSARIYIIFNLIISIWYILGLILCFLGKKYNIIFLLHIAITILWFIYDRYLIFNM